MYTLDQFLKNEYNKVVLSKPTKESLYKKIVIKRLSNAKSLYQAEQYTDTQVTHTNFDVLDDYLKNECVHFKEMYFFGEESFSTFLKNGEITFCKRINADKQAPVTHNKEKNYLIPEGAPIPIFVKIGIFTKEYKVVASMRDKFRQINRYLELLDDCLHDYKENDSIYIADFGCGKSYLSFAVYYFLTFIKKLNVTLDGVDLKESVIKDCTSLANEYGYHGMHFYCMNIIDYKPVRQPDLIISLHACDIATDYVLKQAVESNAKYIFSVPCCQKEINRQITTEFDPILLRYGIIKERISALITDSIRATVLELYGYKTDVLEFVDLSDSPKNLLIRAKKANHAPSYIKAKKQELKELIQRANISPTILKLLPIDLD